MKVYFDVDHFFADSLSVQIFSPDYVKRLLYITVSDNTKKYVFGSITLSKTKIDHIPYMEVEVAEVDMSMRRKGYGRMLYERAYKEALKMGTRGIVSNMRGRSEQADRIWQHYPEISWAGERYNIMRDL